MNIKTMILVLIIIILVVAIGVFLATNNSDGQKTRSEEEVDITTSSQKSTMKKVTLTSEAFQEGGSIPSLYTCDGKNISPALSWTGISEEAQSLVLIMDDPDAVKSVGHVWDHWVVFNIPPTLSHLHDGEQPQGVAGVNSSGDLTYSGPCPPDGEHRYFFKIYALDTMLDLADGATKKDVETAMEGHILAQGGLVGKYVRQ